MTTQIFTGITAGRALCILADGTIVISSRGTTRPGQVTRIAPDGTVLGQRQAPWKLGALAADPSDPDAVVVAAAERGLIRMRLGAVPQTSLLLGLLRAGGVAADPAGGSVLATTVTPPAPLLRVPVPAAGTTTLGSGFNRPIGLTLSADDNAVLALEATAVRRVVRMELADGSLSVVLPDAGTARSIARIAAGDSRLLVGTADGEVLIYDLAAPAAAPQVVLTGLPPVWGVVGDGTTAYVGSGPDLLQVDLPAPEPVRLEMPAEAMFLSSWARIGVVTDATVNFDDLFFFVEPPVGGLVSASRDATFDPATPDVLLAAGALPGTYEVIAIKATTGDRFATGKFTVTDAWTGVDGPPVALIGAMQNYPPDAAWGGGDPFAPQNIDVHPTHGNRPVAVVLAETTDLTALSAADAQTLRDAWQHEVFDGVTRNGVLESAGRYWNAVSDGDLALVNAGVVGPVRLSQAWDTYTTPDSTGQSNGVEPFSRPVIAAIRAQNEQLAANGQPPLVDLRTVESIIVVMRSVPADAAAGFPGRFQWPYATRPGGFQLTFEIARDIVTVSLPFGSIDISVPVNRTIQCVAMPHDWNMRTVRTIAETASHELGHNFGLADQYAPDDPAYPADSLARDPGNWTVMSWERDAPEPTVPEKMMLGWVPPSKVRNLSFATLGPVDEEVVLHAAEHGPAPFGRFSAIEVRIRDGENYYFEYRRDLPTELSDQDVPVDFTVFGTDLVSGDTAPAGRRTLLRLRDDSDADSGEFQTNDDYRETDTTSPKYPNDFEMKVIETQPDFARVHITYGDAKPDPQIRPWAQSTNWKSPDLEVVNARNLANSAFKDLPWEGHNNTIRATVRNPGKVDAHQVRVDFFVKDFTVGGGAETHFGSDVHDVASNATVVFSSPDPWVPPPWSLLPFGVIRPHYCVVARIAEYADPADPAVREITLDNNEAQSNHTQLISASASPSSREGGVVKVTNPYAVPADCFVAVRQVHPVSRTYVEREWVHLQPGEQRDVAFFTESMLGDPALERLTRQFKGFAYEVPNSLLLTGIADTRLGCHGDVTGGAHVVVRAARATEFVRFERNGEVARGRIEAVDTREGVNGDVLVSIRREADDVEGEQIVSAPVQNGNFRVLLKPMPDHGVIQGHYLGLFDMAPCDSKPLELQ